MRDIFLEVRRLHSKLAAQFYFQWCRRGVWSGNERADAEAKKAVTTRDSSIPRRYLSTGHGAIKTAVRKQLRQRRVDAYEQERGRDIHLLSRNFFEWDLVRSGSLRSKDEFKMLTRHQLSVLTGLRTGHSQCNFSKHVLMHHRHYLDQWPGCNGDVRRLRLLRCRGECCSKNNSGMCPHCNVMETEQHFLLDCPGHAALRRRTFGGFRLVYRKLDEVYNLKSLLFPPTALGWKHRKELLRNIVLFAVQTGRFSRYY